MSHTPPYMPSPLQLVSNSQTFFHQDKTFSFKGDGVEISLNVTLSQTPFEFHSSTRLCCFTLSFIYFMLLSKKPHFFVHTPTPPIHTHFSPSPCHSPQLPCGFPCLRLLAYNPFSCATNPTDSRTEGRLYCRPQSIWAEILAVCSRTRDGEKQYCFCIFEKPQYIHISDFGNLMWSISDLWFFYMQPLTWTCWDCPRRIDYSMGHLFKCIHDLYLISQKIQILNSRSTC